MHVISVKVLREFWERHPDAKKALRAWYKHAEGATWKSADEVVTQYPYARAIDNNRVVFKIMGNNYRLVVRIEYRRGEIYIRFVGTHAEYDSIDATAI